MRAGFSIRTKLLFVALLLLLIPWMSYQYVREMKTYLLSGQEEALSLTSRAVATVLHDRPELFVEDSNIDTGEPEGNEIYAAPLPNYINLNGDLSDWGELVNQVVTFAPESTGNEGNVFEVDHVLGYRGNFIYALFQVRDDLVRFRPRSFLRLDAADHVRLMLQDPGREPQRFTLIAGDTGRMSIYKMDAAWQYPLTGEPNYDLAAELDLTEEGYNIELRIPRFMFFSDTRFSLEVVDVDDEESRAIEAILPTTPQSETDELSKVLVQSPEIAKILKGLDRSGTRIWVFNNDKRFLTVVGDLVTGINDGLLSKPTEGSGVSYLWELLRYYYNSALQTIFAYIIERPGSGIDDHMRSVEERNDEVIRRALEGSISSDRRPSLDNQSTILMSGHPIFLGDGILGAVVVEQSTNQILQQQRETLENVISVTLLVLITVATALLVFASRLTVRIRRLRNATETAIDRDGRIIHQKLNADAKSGDEIGDLSRSVSNMLGRLSQYTSYLRGLPDTLAHELSTHSM